MLPPPSVLLLTSPIVSDFYQSAQPVHAFDSGIHLRQSYHHPIKREPFDTPPIFRKTLADNREEQLTPAPSGTPDNVDDSRPYHTQPPESIPPHHQPPYTAPAQQSQFHSDASLGTGGGGWIQTRTREHVSFGSAGVSLGHSNFDRRVSEPTISTIYHAQRTQLAEPTDSESQALRHARQASSSSSSSHPSMKPPVIPVLPSLNYPGQPLHDIPSSPGRLLHGESSHSVQSMSSGISSPTSGGGLLTPPAAMPRTPPAPVSTTEDEATLPASPSSPESASGRKQYSFISLAHPHVKKRPRRRYDEIERLYTCNFPGCTKAYGTLNHLNAHVTMQKHGAKRLPQDFKEMRKQWRRKLKEETERIAAATEARRPGPPTTPVTPSVPTLVSPADFSRNRGLTVAIPEPFPIPPPPPESGRERQGNPYQGSTPYQSTFSPQSASSAYAPWASDAGGSRPTVQFNPQFHYPPPHYTPQSGPEFDPEISPLEPTRTLSPAGPSIQERMEAMGQPSSSTTHRRGPVYQYDRRHSSASVSPVDERLRYPMPPPHARASVDQGIVSYSVTLPPSAHTRHLSQPVAPYPPASAPPSTSHHQTSTRYTGGHLPPDSTLLTPLHLPPRGDSEAHRESTPHASGHGKGPTQ